MTTTLQRPTASELFAMPDDGFRYELVKGEMQKMSPAGTGHGAVVWNLSALLAPHIRASDKGSARRRGLSSPPVSEGDELDGGEVVPGFRRKAAEIFDEPF